MLSRTVIESKIGKRFADTLDEPFVVLCGETWTRRLVVELMGLANLVAVKRLEKALKKLSVDRAPMLYDIDPMSLYRMKGVGDTQVFVAMSLLHAHGYDPVLWWDNFDEKPKAKANRRKADV